MVQLWEHGDITKIRNLKDNNMDETQLFRLICAHYEAAQYAYRKVNMGLTTFAIWNYNLSGEKLQRFIDYVNENSWYD